MVVQPEDDGEAGQKWHHPTGGGPAAGAGVGWRDGQQKHPGGSNNVGNESQHGVDARQQLCAVLGRRPQAATSTSTIVKPTSPGGADLPTARVVVHVEVHAAETREANRSQANKQRAFRLNLGGTMVVAVVAAVSSARQQLGTTTFSRRS